MQKNAAHQRLFPLLTLAMQGPGCEGPAAERTTQAAGRRDGSRTPGPSQGSTDRSPGLVQKMFQTLTNIRRLPKYLRTKKKN